MLWLTFGFYYLLEDPTDIYTVFHVYGFPLPVNFCSVAYSVPEVTNADRLLFPWFYISKGQ